MDEMLDATLIWDGHVLFEKLFARHGLSYQRVPASAIGTPFMPLPESKVMIIPTGFANPQYTGILSGIKTNRSFFDRFVRGGGMSRFVSAIAAAGAGEGAAWVRGGEGMAAAWGHNRSITNGRGERA